MTLDELPLQEISERHKFDLGRLDKFLQPRIDDFGSDLEVLQFAGGASNPTFLLTTHSSSGTRRFVLRKKPPGKILASAHQVEREFRAMSALASTDIPVPVMRTLCEDADVIGTNFYVMNFLEGRIFRDAALPGIEPKERASIYDELNATLAKLHKVDVDAVGLSDFGRRSGYFERQLGRWTKQYRIAQTEEIPGMERLLEELPKRLPTETSTGIAHGDYRLGNVMFHPTEPKLIAVLDWELSTLGHPLADIGYNCLMWNMPSPEFGYVFDDEGIAEGIPTEAEYVAAYCARSGRSGIEDLNFYVGFAAFRIAAISQGIYRRTLDGIASTDREAINEAGQYAKLALELLHRP